MLPPQDTPPLTGQQVVSGQSGRCVDVPNSTTSNGTQVQLWDCGAATGQRWTYTADRRLTVFGGTKCLDANGAGTSAGTARNQTGRCSIKPSRASKGRFPGPGPVEGGQPGAETFPVR
ncbi:ricin-type beta-trefoil lectin domain protein [Micromonospora sp. KC207]|uniref:ricin-type beta-trefoil lectin domain protein n=1 Tax=Micromonospora sp. KC207 TaxID=2530377 RepID=UPI0026CC020B